MKINPVQLIPIGKLHPNPDNPKKTFGARYRKGLKASLQRWGFAGLLVVASNDDGTYEVLDGNTRLEELQDAGVEAVPCVVMDNMSRDERKTFVLAHDRNRKVFDEDAVVAQLTELAGRTQDLADLATVTSTENLRQIVEATAQRTRGTVRKAAESKPAVMASLTIYGPAEDVDAVRQLLKRIKGKLADPWKARATLEQADQYLDLTDEAFLCVFGSALERYFAGGGG